MQSVSKIQDMKLQQRMYHIHQNRGAIDCSCTGAFSCRDHDDCNLLDVVIVFYRFYRINQKKVLLKSPNSPLLLPCELACCAVDNEGLTIERAVLELVPFHTLSMCVFIASL